MLGQCGLTRGRDAAGLLCEEIHTHAACGTGHGAGVRHHAQRVDFFCFDLRVFFAPWTLTGLSADPHRTTRAHDADPRMRILMLSLHCLPRLHVQART
jgi:hypothetical protein